jgi:cysteine desulfuration protein SufE
MSIAAKQAEIIEELEMFSDWQEKFGYVIDHGKDMPNMDDQYRSDENIVHGCQNKVYIASNFDGALVHYIADSEAQIPRGLLSILMRVLGDETPEDILTAELDFIDKAGIRDNLSMQRSNGLESMIRRMKLEAAKYIKN